MLWHLGILPKTQFVRKNRGTGLRPRAKSLDEGGSGNRFRNGDSITNMSLVLNGRLYLRFMNAS